MRDRAMTAAMSRITLTRRAVLGCAALGFARSASAQTRTTLVLAAAGPGSAFLPFGEAVKPVIERYAPITVEIRQTKGSNENADLLNAGEVQIATLNMGPGFE